MSKSRAFSNASLGVLLGAYAFLESHFTFLKWLCRRRPFKTTLNFQETGFNEAVISRCSTLLKFRPSICGQGPLMQLYLAVLCPARNIPYIRESLVSHGSQLLLDWTQSPEKNPTAPTLIILHGIAGHSEERYVRRMAAMMMDHGWMVLVYNRRGHGTIPRASSTEQLLDLDSQLSATQPGPRSVHGDHKPTGPRPWALFSDMDDMDKVVEHVAKRRPHSVATYAAGYSAGSNCLTKYVGEKGGDCKLAAAVSIANGYDLEAGLKYLARSAPLMDRMITLKFMQLYTQLEEAIESQLPSKIEKRALKSIRTIRQMDEHVTAKLYNFTDVDHYYRDHSCITTMADVKVPMLLLNAADDPLMDPVIAGLGHQFANVNPNIISIVTSHGGHLGWVTGYRKQWMSSAIADYLLAVHSSRCKGLTTSSTTKAAGTTVENAIPESDCTSTASCPDSRLSSIGLSSDT